MVFRLNGIVLWSQQHQCLRKEMAGYKLETLCWCLPTLCHNEDD